MFILACAIAALLLLTFGFSILNSYAKLDKTDAAVTGLAWLLLLLDMYAMVVLLGYVFGLVKA